MSFKLQQAALFAAKEHDGQTREGEMPLPYITHPMEVLSNLRYVGNVLDEDMLCAAALHDVLEETEVSASEIETLFGNRVKNLVVELTRYEPTEAEREGLTKDEIWTLRSETLLKEISEMGTDAIQIKLADRLSNLREARFGKTGKKLERYRDQSRKILKMVPRTANPGLWDAISSELERG